MAGAAAVLACLEAPCRVVLWRAAGCSRSPPVLGQTKHTTTPATSPPAGALYYKSFSKGGSSHKSGNTPKAAAGEDGNPEKLPLVHADATLGAQAGIGAGVEQK